MKSYLHLWYLAEFFLEWEMLQTKFVDKIKKSILCSITCFFFENRALYEMMWKKHGRAGQLTNDNIIRKMRFACWITKATDTHSKYVILIAFSRQQWLRERASMLGYTYIACVVSYCYFEKRNAECSGHTAIAKLSLWDTPLSCLNMIFLDMQCDVPVLLCKFNHCPLLNMRTVFVRK
jgi:hypothetical protein